LGGCRHFSVDGTPALASFFLGGEASTRPAAGASTRPAAKASTRPAAERVTFFACAKKVTKESTPQAARPPGILPCGCANALRGPLNVRPCTCSELARILRAILRTFPARIRRASWGPNSAASCRRSRSKRREANAEKQRTQAQMRSARQSQRRSPWMDGARATTGAVRGAEHRRRDGKMPEGSRRWIAAIAKQYRDVLSEQPRRAEKHRAVRFARCESDHRVRCLAFLPTFWAMPKSRWLAAGETMLCTSRRKIKMFSRLRGNDGIRAKAMDSGSAGDGPE